ncbi:MAG: hypothetical protein AAFX45_07310 [Pseudomonadota bacterium]
MSAQLALDLDHDAIRLLSRQSDGWVVEGVAALSAENITERITNLRQRAEDLVGPDPAVTLVLPRSQVLYTRFEGAGPVDVGAELEHLTPYDLADITWDTVETDTEVLVAAVAYETLDEAVAFATSSRFRIVGLTSEPPEGLFPRLPVFAQRKTSVAAAAPIVLEPATPPARQDVAFSSQRTRSYAPKGVRPPGRLHLRPAAAAAARAKPAAFLAALSAVPTPARAAIGVVALLGLGFFLWPERDPDPFAQRDFVADFARIPTAETQGIVAPRVDSRPEFAAFEAATLLRDPPVITIPVVIGSSGIDLDAVAGVAPEQVFAARAAKPVSPESGVTLVAAPERPNLPQLSTLPVPDGFLSGTVARAEPPLALATLPRPDGAPTVPAIRVAGPRIAETSPLGEVALPLAPRIEVEPLAKPVEPQILLAALPAEPEASQSVTLSALPAGQLETTLAPRLPDGTLTEPLPNAAMALPPAAPGQAFALAEDGFVEATPEGTRSPDGILVFAGRPDLIAPPRPVAPPPEVNVGDPALAAVQPRPRPAVARSADNPVALASTVMLDDDPASARSLLSAPEVPEDLIAEALAAEPEPEVETVEEPARTILTASLVPRPRPTRPAAPTTAAPTAPTQASATRAAVPAPQIPSSANVAREATIENGIRFQRINLIGVYGAASDRRALVRLPSGKFIKLQVGDRLDGGRVAQIGPDTLVYQKGGRSLALSMPST